MLNKQRLSVALSTIHKDERGRHFSSGQFTSLLGDVQINIALGASLDGLRNSLAYIHQDVWNLETIAQRLNWQKGLIAKGKLDELLGGKFAQCDIDLFHVQYRSLFDHLAKIIDMISDKPDRLNQNLLRSFIIGSAQNLMFRRLEAT